MVALRDKLRADHAINAALFDVAEFLAHALDRGDEIARKHENASIGKQRMRLFLEPLHAGPAGNKGVGRVAFRTGGGWRRGEAAMMADELSLEAVIDQPCVALRALHKETAGAAERQRCITAAIEEEQRLIAAFQRGLHDAGKARRDEASPRRAFAL